MTDATPPSAYDDWTQSLLTQLGERSLRYLDDEAGKALASVPDGQAGKPATFRIGAYVDEGSYGEVNDYARQELAEGAQDLLFRLYRQPNTRDIRQILKGIDATQVGLHCSLRYPGQDPAELFRDLVHYLRGEGYDLRRIRGSVDFDPLLDWSDPPFPPLVRLLSFVSRWMPNFAVLQVNAAGFNNGPESADSELALALAKGAEYLQEIDRHGYSTERANHHLKFALTVGTSYYVDVAKIRTLRRLWPRVLNELGITGEPPITIAAHTDITTLTGNREENERSTLQQGHAAATGGADLLYLTPIEQIDEPPTLHARRYAIDTQKQLKEHLPPVADEACLNVVIDVLTEATWAKYRKLVAQGGFAMATEL